MEREKYSDAHDQILFALNLDSTNINNLLLHGNLLLINNDSLEAEIVFRKILSLDSTCWKCFKHLGEISDWKGDSTMAISFFENYLRNIYTKDPEVELRLQKLRNKN